MKVKILVTGIAGFIGFHLCKKLIAMGYKIIGIDNLNDYYDTNLKKSRIRKLQTISEHKLNSFEFYISNLESIDKIEEIFRKHSPNIVINLAAQAGVRYSVTNPIEYINSNIYGFLNILENCKKAKVEHLIYASSSSVYGGNKKIPFSENDPVEHPVSLYASTKRSNELMAHNYSHLFNLPTTGLRFFTVYGPWGRPDMAPMIFAKAIFSKKPIKIFNYGKMSRDFTFIDDTVEYIYRLLDKPPISSKFINQNIIPIDESWAPFRILNVGNGNPLSLMNFINLLESEIGISADKLFIEMKKEDVKETAADITKIIKLTGYKPKTLLVDGIKEFITWYKDYYF
tara:strand:+ start:395 stop:1420 length:1026 start_codon:yes stop_codon:yes gene_type:complete